MNDSLRLCKNGHDLDRVGQNRSRQCRACRRDSDRAREVLRRQRRKLGDSPTPFKDGEGFLFDKRGFAWHEDCFLAKGRLLALCKYMTDPHRPTHPWGGMASHAICFIQDEHMDPWAYQAEFYPTRSGKFYFASQEQMQSFRDFLDFLEHPEAEEPTEQMKGAST